MGLLKVDESKCKKDGLCKRECPVIIIKMEEGEDYPYITPQDESACLRCGHCIAVCPHGALSHEYIRLEDCPEIRKELIINEAQAMQFLRSRRSIRLYKDRPVEREKIERLINAGRHIRLRNDPNNFISVIHDRNTTQLMFSHCIQCFLQIIFSPAGHYFARHYRCHFRGFGIKPFGQDLQS